MSEMRYKLKLGNKTANAVKNLNTLDKLTY
jgi:hypothetical protein